LLGFVILNKFRGFWETYKNTFTENASANMEDMFMFVDPNLLFMANMFAVVVIPLMLWLATGNLMLGLGILIALVVIPATIYKIMRTKRLKRFEQQLPDGLLAISGAMRAGASLNVALENVVREQSPPLGQEFELFLREQRIGVEFEKSLTHMEKRLPIQDFLMLCSALRINREIGGNLAEILDTLADTLRKKQAMDSKIQSLTAQGRLQGIVMTGLPILLGILLNFLEPEAMSKLFDTTIGLMVFGLCAVMLTLGYLWIRKIVSIDV
ncbi:MAG: type II secretion system F family protein, partial [Pseudohongiellaceae bacterium]